MKERLNKTESDALQLYFSGLSEVEAYKQTHPKATEKTAKGNANNFFKVIRKKTSTSEIMDFAELNANRIFKELVKMLNATSTVYFQGKKIADEADNNTRFKAIELLTRLTGLERKIESETQENDPQNEPRITLVLRDTHDDEETVLDFEFKNGKISESEYRSHKQKEFDRQLQLSLNALKQRKESPEIRQQTHED